MALSRRRRPKTSRLRLLRDFMTRADVGFSFLLLIMILLLILI
jgi:hypothetical protein